MAHLGNHYVEKQEQQTLRKMIYLHQIALTITLTSLTGLITLSVSAQDSSTTPIPTWKMLESVDIDKDDKITKQEFLSSDKVFTAIDKNKDGHLTATELSIARKSTPPAPKVGDKAPDVKALDPITGEMILLSQRKKPLALIFGTHT